MIALLLMLFILVSDCITIRTVWMFPGMRWVSRVCPSMSPTACQLAPTA